MAASGLGGGNYGYAGEWTDSSGLQYLRARYYSPSTGRFISKDPFPGLLTQPASLTPYVYALNSPVLYSDPSGEFVETPLDVLFIGYDLVSLGADVYRIATNRCDFLKEQLNRQLAIDAGALALDLIFLAIPAPPGAGGLFRLAFAGANYTMDLYRAASVLNLGYRGLQILNKMGQVQNQIGSSIAFAKISDDNAGYSSKRGGRPQSNQAQNAQFKGAVQEIERQIGRSLKKGEIQQLRYAIHDLEDPGFWAIVDEGLGMFGGK